MKLIVGLGNPGKRYERTRHNVGFMVLDRLHTALKPRNISSWELSKKFNAELAGVTTVHNEKIILAKPMTFMNDSGASVQLIAHYYKLAPTDIVVVHDDKDLALGKFIVQINRGHAGHNGVRSIIEHLNTKNFTRIRIGIGKDDQKKLDDVPEFVLGKFGLLERKQINAVMESATEKLIRIIEGNDTLPVAQSE